MLPMFLCNENAGPEPEGNERVEEQLQEVNVPARRLRVPRVFRDPLDPLNIADDHLLRYYRFPRHEIIELTDMVSPALARKTRRSHALPVIIQVLVSLRFLASGTFQNILADTGHISQSSASRIIGCFCATIVEMANQFILLAIHSQQYILNVKEGFYRIAEFPNVIGCVDGTHIRIKKPKVDPDNYMNRKGFFSVNVQVACDATLKLTNVCIRWPGSTHDGFIWDNSELKRALEQWEGNGWLLGDSGYPSERRLLTRFRNPTTNAEERYNAAHIRTRNTIERTIGLWKSRFRCIDTSGGSLQYSVEKVRNIIIASAVLHNRCVERRIPVNQDLPPEGVEEELQALFIDYPNDLEGIRVRREVVDRYFTN